MKVFRKKKESKACSCGLDCISEIMVQVKENMRLDIKILGSGCAKCAELEKSTREAIEQLGLDTNIEHIRDFEQIASYGVMTTPALVVDGKVISYGKVLSVDEVKKL